MSKRKHKKRKDQNERWVRSKNNAIDRSTASHRTAAREHGHAAPDPIQEIAACASAPQIASVPEAELVAYEDNLLESARTQWQFGDWGSLAALTVERIQHHPERAKLALLAAAGRFQCADLNDAHRFVRMAQDWGCSKRLAGQILTSGAHQSLAEAAKRLGQDERAQRHWAESVKWSGVPGDLRLLTRVRSAWDSFESR